MKTVRITVKGKVRGFGFRFRAAYLANSLQLKGYVSFLGETTLIIVIQGDENAVEKFFHEISSWDQEAGFLEVHRENILYESCADFVIIPEMNSDTKTDGSPIKNVKNIYSVFNDHFSLLYTKWQNFIK